MPLPSEPVTLSVAQLEELNRKLSTMRHDINNHLSLIVAAVELIRHKPQMMERMMSTLAEQPGRISGAVSNFSKEFEQALRITRG
jgi:aspartokinase